MSEYIYISQNVFTGSGAPESGSNAILTRYSLQQLYYSSFDNTGSVLTSSSFDNYLESSFITSSRTLGDVAVAYSIPQNIVGTNIEPGSLILGEDYLYIEDQPDYVEYPMYFEEYAADVDNGEGRLVVAETANYDTPGRVVGDVIYSHGMVIVTDETKALHYISNSLQPITWKSNQPIYTYNYDIKVSDYEFNYTYNPTAQTGGTVFHYSGSSYYQPSGILADNVTGSYFQPYITTVGLYNDANELIAVAKLAQPLPKPANTELTIQIKLDI